MVLVKDLNKLREEISRRRYWEVEYEDGTILTEHSYEWKSIPKVNIVRLSLYYDGREWNITGKDSYVQKKRASMVPGIPESFVIESRSIGYYEGKNKVWYTVDELTGKMTMEVFDI